MLVGKPWHNCGVKLNFDDSLDNLERQKIMRSIMLHRGFDYQIQCSNTISTRHLERERTSFESFDPSI